MCPPTAFKTPHNCKLDQHYYDSPKGGHPFGCHTLTHLGSHRLERAATGGDDASVHRTHGKAVHFRLFTPVTRVCITRAICVFPPDPLAASRRGDGNDDYRNQFPR